MVQPENVNPRNFQVQQVLYNDGDFSIAWGKWQGGNMRMAMRWNGEGDDPGYPSAFKNPIWFLVSDKLDIQIFRALFGAESVDINAIMAAIGGLSEISSKKVASLVADVDAIKNSIGNHTTPIINIGNLIGKMLLIDDGLVIPITITPTSQDVFEQDLKLLFDIVKNHRIPITLKFDAGGTLALPDWFISACKRIGVHIEVSKMDDIYKRSEISSKTDNFSPSDIDEIDNASFAKKTCLQNPFIGPMLSYYDQDCKIFEFVGMYHIFMHDSNQCEKRYGSGYTLDVMMNFMSDLFFWNHTCSHFQASVIKCFSNILLFENDCAHYQFISEFVSNCLFLKEKGKLCSFVGDHLKILENLLLDYIGFFKIKKSIGKVCNILYHNSIPTIYVGNIYGHVLSINDGVIAVDVNSTNQVNFEIDLKTFLNILKKLSRPITLLLSKHGKLVLPEWFKNACRELGIEIVILESEKQLPEMIKRYI